MYFYEKLPDHKSSEKTKVDAWLSQMEVSTQLGITQSQYSRLEKSESDPTKYLVRFSKNF